MRKRYIILTTGIYDMGGAEMYTSNKIKYLQSIGWETEVFYMQRGTNILLENLKEYEDNYIPELIYRFIAIPPYKRKHVIERILKNTPVDCQVVIESHLLNLCLWGELIARKINGRSILNAMEEKVMLGNKGEARFIEYKLKRWEILNTSEINLKRYLQQWYKPEFNKYIHNLFLPYCSNVTEEIDMDVSDIRKSDYTILSLGRLDKPYLLPALRNLIYFIEKYADKTFNLMIIGGSPDESVEKKIQEMFRELSNVRIYMYGYLYPIPVKLIQRGDVGLAIANSVDVITDCGVPTINFDINDLGPIGIYKDTTQNKFVRKAEPVRNLEELLEDILIYGNYHKEYFNKDNIHRNDSSDIFQKQVEFLELGAKDNAYYDVEAIYTKYDFTKSQLKFFIKKILQ